jgi:pycsar effector protein
MTRDLTAQLVADLRVEVARADNKASVLIAAMGLGLGAPLGLSPINCLEKGINSISWWLGCTLWAAALGCLLIALTPRYRRSSWSDGAALSSFADIHRASKAGQLPEAVHTTELDERTALLATAADLSHIILLKYRWIRTATIAFGLGTMSVALTLLGR